MAHDPWKKPSPELVDRFHEAVAGIDGVEERRMFGFPAAFIGGQHDRRPAPEHRHGAAAGR